MATKTKTKDKLKNILVNELKSKKEDEKKVRQKENANLSEVTVYTKFSCPFCKQTIDKLEEEGIKYVEKPQVDFEIETNDVFNMTGMPIFPTLHVNGEYLVPRRDFQNPQQLIDRLKQVAVKDFKQPPFEPRMVEMLKSTSAGTNQVLTQINQQLQQINTRLGPITEFIDNIKAQIEEEESE
jgi:glutaredoxin